MLKLGLLSATATDNAPLSVNLLGLAVSLIDLVVTLYIYCTNVSGMLMWVGGVGKYLVGSLYKY